MDYCPKKKKNLTDGLPSFQASKSKKQKAKVSPRQTQEPRGGYSSSLTLHCTIPQRQRQRQRQRRSNSAKPLSLAQEMGAATDIDRPTLRISNIPQTAIAADLFQFLESKVGPRTVYAIEILTDHKDWKSRGFGRVQFVTLEAKSKAHFLSLHNQLLFKSHSLQLSETYDDIIPRPIRADHRLDAGILHGGFMVQDDRFRVLEKWEGVRGWLMPERRRLEFWVSYNDECYKLDLLFDDISETVGCKFNGSTCNALLLRVKFAPRIYQKVSGPNIASKFRPGRYRMCQDNYDFLWVRTTDFSIVKSIGQSNSFYWEFSAGLSRSDMFYCFPCYREDMGVTLEHGPENMSECEIVPLVKGPSDSKLAYEILFQLNSLVHTQKISIAAVDTDLIDILSGLPIQTAVRILQKFHKLQSTCYDPVSFVKTKLLVSEENFHGLPLSPYERLIRHNVMSCHRALVTPSKIYCFGPELEKSNYVVKHFAEYASDFMRVTFVEEDWSKLSANAISTSIQLGILPKPSRTKIYHRILSVLQNGIVIGDKRFEFLAFSASQLRSNSVWMFASNDKVKAEDIREWMGCFKKIRSISKCAARMGQLFSSSSPTLEVPVQDVDIIPDIEVTTDDTDYCFSDGIGKISLPFARQVAMKCGLNLENEIPSAFQIRYGGYKGVVAVDRNSFKKMSLRRSMLKFDSNVRMLNVTKWSESMPCFLNREIVALLSTLGIKDEVLEKLQEDQLCVLGKMLANREAALDALQSIGGADSKNILVNMLLQGYEPNVEPYLSMMLLAHHESLLSDLKTRCRIFVPKGRVLLGCLDETGVLNYGQVFVRLKLRKAELECPDQSYFHKVDEKTAIVIGKVVVTKNPCLHPGDVRVLEAVYDAQLEEKGLVDCLVFPQKGERPHPNECSGGDLDGDQFFISWDKDLIPCQTDAPMDYTARRPRIMDHDVTLEEIHKFFVDYMINDNLGAISTAHLVHADRELDKARSTKCLELADLHSMAVDFAKTGAPAQMPKALKPREFPDFMQRTEKPTYISNGVLGKLYRATNNFMVEERSKKMAEEVYDHDLKVSGFEEFLSVAQVHKDMYQEKMSFLMNYYEVKSEDEILTGNMRNKAMFLQRDNRRYGETKDRILLAVKNLQREAREWFENGCKADKPRLPPDQQPTVSVYASIIQPKDANTLIRRLNQVAPLEHLRHVKRIHKRHLQVQEGNKTELSVILCLACDSETQSNTMPPDVREIVDSYHLSPFITKVSKDAALSKEEWEEQCKLWPTSYHPPTYNIDGITGFSEEDTESILSFMKFTVELAKSGDNLVVNAAVIVDPSVRQMIVSACDEVCSWHTPENQVKSETYCFEQLEAITSHTNANRIARDITLLPNGSFNDLQQCYTAVSCLNPWEWAQHPSNTSPCYWHPLRHAAIVAIEASAARDRQLFPGSGHNERSCEVDCCQSSPSVSPAKRQKMISLVSNGGEQDAHSKSSHSLDRPYLCTGYDIYLAWEPCT
ncbi:RNA-dependent RNA polymerase, eukaryotic-type, partial [Corchorus capsularis]